MTKTRIQMRHPSETPDEGVDVYVRHKHSDDLYLAHMQDDVFLGQDINYDLGHKDLVGWCYADDLEFLPPKPPMPTVNGVTLHPMDVHPSRGVIGFKKGASKPLDIDHDLKSWGYSNITDMKIDPREWHGWLDRNELRLTIDGGEV